MNRYNDVLVERTFSSREDAVNYFLSKYRLVVIKNGKGLYTIDVYKPQDKTDNEIVVSYINIKEEDLENAIKQAKEYIIDEANAEADLVALDIKIFKLTMAKDVINTAQVV